MIKKIATFSPKKLGMKNQYLFSLALILSFAVPASAQGNNPDFFHSIGKIYVVVAVIIAIFIGIILFMIYLERKVSKLENLSKHPDNE